MISREKIYVVNLERTPSWASSGKSGPFCRVGHTCACAAGVMMDDLVDIRQGLSSPDFQQLGLPAGFRGQVESVRGGKGDWFHQ